MYMNEDLMWERLKDMQREAENSRLWAAAHPNPFRGLRDWVAKLASRSTQAQPPSLREDLLAGERDVA